ncbi:MAG: Eco57I restriction-modification methylase domain-containing protein [Planctomycetia bacterium]|nr:Eco57I restriction-modification methylase domain-containing protein [Planctomycetia bacterium]
MPISFFGDFHQLCVANPLGTVASRRYERGIHYTPAPIVDYLVNAILDRAFAGRSIDEIKRLRLLDPSCGCGAFLIAVLRYVLRWLDDHAGNADDSVDSWFQERFDVLSEMLFGIDIDERAVTWTIRLLLLAVWEASVVDLQDGRQCAVAPPDLRANIICRSFLDVEDNLPHGCVDAIVGGPPFVRLRELYRSQREQIAAYRRQFQSARRGQFDLYMLFIEKALDVLADGGYLGFSLSNSFIRTLGGNRMRRIIAQRSRIIEIVEFEDKEVYPEAVTQIALLSLAKKADLYRSRHVLVKSVGDIRAKLGRLSHADVGSAPDLVMHDMPSHAFDWPDWHLLPHEDTAWLAHIRFVGRPLEQFLGGIGQGLNTGADDVFLMWEVGRTFKQVVFGRSRVDGKTYRLEGNVTRTIIRGRHIRGYRAPDSRDLCIFPYDSDGRVLSEDNLRADFPHAYQYLMQCRLRLAERPAKDGLRWYAASRDEAIPRCLSVCRLRIPFAAAIVGHGPPDQVAELTPGFP